MGLSAGPRRSHYGDIMKIIKSAGLACISFLFVFAASAEAIKGTNFLETTSQTVTELGNGLTATQQAQTGPASAASDSGIFAGATFYCVATIIANSEGEVSSNRGHCMTTHANGELTWLWFNGSNALDGNWGFLDGTGVYEGIEGTGTFANDVDGNGTYEGNWEIAAE